MNKPPLRAWRGASAAVAVAFISAGLTCIPVGANAEINAEMSTMFNSMATETPPNSYNTALRGGVSGGDIQVKNRIMNQQLVTIVPPSFSAGCGGIDLFGGSFSYVNAAQFTAFLRSIASNAAGYAFELALQAMCGSCMSTIETLEKKVQELDQMFSNSCQVAQGAVNDGLAALSNQQNNSTSVINSVQNGLGDIFDTSTNTSGSTPIQQALNGGAASTTALANQIEGNVVWRALQNQGASSWFANGDASFLELMMAISGTIIVSAPANDTVGTGQQNYTYNTVAPTPELLNELINGGTVTIQGCTNNTDGPNGCTTLTQKSITITGFNSMIQDAYLGDGTSAGIIAKIATNANGSFTPAEAAIIGVLPNGISGAIQRLAPKDPQAAQSLVEKATPEVSLWLARTLELTMLAAVDQSVNASSDQSAPRVQALVTTARHEIMETAEFLQDRYGSLDQVTAYYKNLDSIEPVRLPNLPSLLGSGKQ